MVCFTRLCQTLFLQPNPRIKTRTKTRLSLEGQPSSAKQTYFSKHADTFSRVAGSEVLTQDPVSLFVPAPRRFFSPCRRSVVSYSMVDAKSFVLRSKSYATSAMVG
ncbi:hypothetical protein H112_06507 [Trichophyton rubrum D6]|uniref:Uncharacterized protein n=3 Tax=Trichophyton TaxID=5550 RepID=A0A080WRE2_TRIRC|nr:uncharacterized protein TERG_11772 [Trichophyton rubrum CBS 118892]EZF12966.1 hypothetical protein H100_06523 [Trichophyton rubrum MR850]EZF39398.1 hypothetical protein H102_06490 [Trichophyton rubrum CBS 100081]EZF49982.1 hypothetical protein H103_06516 [Trichophyton rubrum CBS 288.86]EZF60632.1 hypothetical protein H104_06498 [Trichophyton rubrum CBS 289.86]EZF71261.1 hypothetical protein H105_06527 [Trichophyton soudanense CBS 452.61]EZF81954.1 hypothetical protein H110_06510 [Trichophy